MCEFPGNWVHVIWLRPFAPILLSVAVKISAIDILIWDSASDNRTHAMSNFTFSSSELYPKKTVFPSQKLPLLG